MIRAFGAHCQLQTRAAQLCACAEMHFGVADVRTIGKRSAGAVFVLIRGPALQSRPPKPDRRTESHSLRRASTPNPLGPVGLHAPAEDTPSRGGADGATVFQSRWTSLLVEVARTSVHSGWRLYCACTYGQIGMILKPLARASEIICSTRAAAAPVPRMLSGACVCSALMSAGP